MLDSIRKKIYTINKIKTKIEEQNKKIKNIEKLIISDFEEFKNVVLAKSEELTEQESNLKKINSFVYDYSYSFYDSFSSSDNIKKSNNVIVDSRKGLLMFSKKTSNEIKIKETVLSSDGKNLKVYFSNESYFNYLNFLFYSESGLPISPFVNYYNSENERNTFFENYMKFYDKNMDDLYNEYYSLPKKASYVEFVFDESVDLSLSFFVFNLIEFINNDNYVIIDIGKNDSEILSLTKNIFESVFDVKYSISSDLTNFYDIKDDLIEKDSSLLNKNLYLKISFSSNNHKFISSNSLEYTVTEIEKPSTTELFYIQIDETEYSNEYLKIKINYNIYKTLLKTNKSLVYSENGSFFFNFKNILIDYTYDEIMENTIFSDTYEDEIKTLDEINVFIKDNKVFMPNFIFENLLSIYVKVGNDYEFLKKCCSPFVFEIKIK